MYTQTIKRISLVLLAAFILSLSCQVAAAQPQEKAAPISRFITPTEGSPVTGVINVEVFMRNGYGQEVVMGVDNNNWQGMDYAGNGRYTTTWDTNPVADGQHTLTARFSSNLDKTAPQPATVNVYVFHELPPDQQENIVPVSHFIKPYNGSFVSGLVKVEVFMLNGNGQDVILSVDGHDWQKMTYQGASRYTTAWNTNYISDGEHTLSAHFLSSDDADARRPFVNVFVINELPPAID